MYSVQFLFLNSDLVSNCIIYYGYINISIYTCINIHTIPRKIRLLHRFMKFFCHFIRRTWLKFYFHCNVTHSISLYSRNLGHFLLSNLQSKKKFFLPPSPPKRGLSPLVINFMPFTLNRDIKLLNILTTVCPGNSILWICLGVPKCFEFKQQKETAVLVSPLLNLLMDFICCVAWERSKGFLTEVEFEK